MAEALVAAAEAYLEEDEASKAVAAADEALEAFAKSSPLKDASSPGTADALRAKYRAHCQLGQRKAALKDAKEELERRQLSRDLRGEAVMRLAISEIVLEKMGSKHRNEAIPNATKAASIFGDVDDVRLEATALLVIATAYIKRSAPAMDVNKESQLALDHAKDALALFRETKDRKGEASALHTISVGYIHLREYRQAIQMSRQAVKIYKEMGARKLEAFELRILARWHLRKDEPDQAWQAAQESYELFRQLADEGQDASGWEVAALAAVVQAFMAGDDIDSAMNAANSGLHRAEERGEKSSQAAVHDLLRELYHQKGDFEAAGRCAETALRLVKEAGDTAFEAELLLQQAPTMEAARSELKASDSVKRAIDIFKDLRREKDRADAFQYLSDIHLAKKEEHDALKAAEEAKALHETLDNAKGVAIAYLSAGQVHHSSLRLAEALKAYNEALAIFREGNDRRGEAEVLSHLARLHADDKDVKQALKVAIQSRSLYLELGWKKQLLEGTIHVAQLQVMSAREMAVLGADSTAPGREVSNALATAREAVAMARRRRDARAIVFAQHTEVEVLITCGEYEEAMRILNDALALCLERGFDAEHGRIISDVAQVHISKKDWGMASEAANKALSIAQKAMPWVRNLRLSCWSTSRTRRQAPDELHKLVKVPRQRQLVSHKEETMLAHLQLQRLRRSRRLQKHRLHTQALHKMFSPGACRSWSQTCSTPMTLKMTRCSWTSALTVCPCWISTAEFKRSFRVYPGLQPCCLITPPLASCQT